jgi:hypothetical protein
MRDLASMVHPIVGLAPAAAAITDNTAQATAIIDRQGYESLTFLIITGTLADADATFAVTMVHGDQSNLSDSAAVPADALIGTLSAAGFTFADDAETRKIGYAGDRRYVRLTITPSGNTGAAPMAVIALLGDPMLAPTPNPPV